MSQPEETDNEKSKNQAKGNGDEKPPLVKDQISVTHHTFTLNGQEIPYTVTCGTIVLKEEVEKGENGGASEGQKPKASIFFVAYCRDDVADKTTRPLTFSFNGGPGSSSVWLHLGVLGPKRVLLDEIGNPLPPPYRLVNNEYSLLDLTDMVFIDPVSTGFSRVIPGEKAKSFHGFSKDIESVGDFIRLYTSRYQRWGSPKFLIGESYGTTRAAGLSGYLQDRHGLFLNGIMLISAILNFQTARFEAGNDLPYILFLPTYAATAWYHRRLPDFRETPLPDFLEEVEAFAAGEYNFALMKGASLQPEERQVVVEKLVRYTGLSADYIERTDLRIQIHRFTKELLRSEGKTIGRLDSRFKGIDRDGAGEYPDYDPSLTNIMGPYTAMFNAYVRGDLEFESDLPYEILNPKVWPWSYAEFENRYLEVAETLRKAITINPFLKVYVGNGYYDLATPYFATRYTFSHMGLNPELQQNISMGYYEAGHMMYVHIPSLAKMKADLGNFIESCIPGQEG